MTRDYSASDEAKRVRSARRALRHAQADDPFVERARLIAFWKKCAETNKAYTPHNGAWWHVLTWHPSWRKLLMPRLRARLDARDRAHDEKYRAELQASSKRWAAIKAERTAKRAHDRALANAPALPLFSQAEGSTC